MATPQLPTTATSEPPARKNHCKFLCEIVLVLLLTRLILQGLHSLNRSLRSQPPGNHVSCLVADCGWFFKSVVMDLQLYYRRVLFYMIRGPICRTYRVPTVRVNASPVVCRIRYCKGFESKQLSLNFTDQERSGPPLRFYCSGMAPLTGKAAKDPIDKMEEEGKLGSPALELDWELVSAADAEPTETVAAPPGAKPVPTTRFKPYEGQAHGGGANRCPQVALRATC